MPCPYPFSLRLLMHSCAATAVAYAGLTTNQGSRHSCSSGACLLRFFAALIAQAAQPLLTDCLQCAPLVNVAWLLLNAQKGWKSWQGVAPTLPANAAGA